MANTDPIRAAVWAAIIEVTENLRTDMIELMVNSKPYGRIYRRGDVEHQASAPGQPPAPDTGNLLSKINTDYDETTLTGRVLIEAGYGAHLEYGTVNMEPRPFVRPTINYSADTIDERVRVSIAEAIKANQP